jgi:hypothetical protein
MTFDGKEPMRKVGRFLYLPWPRGTAAWQEARKCFSAEHDGWRNVGVTHRREVFTPAAEEFVIADIVNAPEQHFARLHWLLGDWEHSLDIAASRLWLKTPGGGVAVAWSAPNTARVTLVRAEPSSNRGWWSPYYFHAAPALSLTIDFAFRGEIRVQTRFGPALS